MVINFSWNMVMFLFKQSPAVWLCSGFPLLISLVSSWRKFNIRMFLYFFLFSNHGNYLHKQPNCTVYSLNKEMVPCWSVFHQTRIQLWCSRCKRSAVSTIWSEGKIKSVLSVFSYIAYNAYQICLTLFSRGWPSAACLAKLEKRGAHLLTAS